MTTTPDEPAGGPVTPVSGAPEEESVDSQEETVKEAKRATESAGKERPQDQADDVATSEPEAIGDDVRDTFKD